MNKVNLTGSTECLQGLFSLADLDGSLLTTPGHPGSISPLTFLTTSQEQLQAFLGGQRMLIVLVQLEAVRWEVFKADLPGFLIPNRSGAAERG